MKLGFPAEYAPLIGWLFIVTGAAVLLFKVKLPQTLKYAILAYSGFVFYNSAMLSVYSLIPLLMFLILWIYPKRREHGVLYGLLIALLANTHIFICGIVGILGIFMLVDLFAQWKSSSKTENAGKLAGLAIAGFGVLLLVIPLIGSADANGAVGTSLSFSPRAVFLAATTTFSDIFRQIVQPCLGGSAWFVILMIATLMLWCMIILLRHWKRALAVEIGFIVFYSLTCGLFWITIPNFILSFAFSLGIAQYENPIFKENKIINKITTGSLKKLLALLESADKHAERTFAVILAVFLAVSVPSGVSMLYRDISGSFSSAKNTAEYISDNFEEDAVFVVLRCGLPELSIYDSSIRLYAAGSGEFCTFAK